MTLIEEMYAELHPDHFILGIGIGETALKHMGRRKNHFSFPVIINSRDELIGLRHNVNLAIDSLVACDSIEVGIAMTPQELLAVQYGADAGYEHRSVITERALRGA